jgi:hypothetical protein
MKRRNEEALVRTGAAGSVPILAHSTLQDISQGTSAATSISPPQAGQPGQETAAGCRAMVVARSTEEGNLVVGMASLFQEVDACHSLKLI